jgi:ElaA protein
MQWTWKKFSELSPSELYEILKLRQKVFVVEQNCAYLDCDDLDQHSIHLLGLKNEKLLAYLRILPPGLKFPEASLGRVVTTAEARGSGAGKLLMTEALRKIEILHGKIPVRISAQSNLQKFYADFGFQSQGSEYLEDNIPQVKMLRP